MSPSLCKLIAKPSQDNSTMVSTASKASTSKGKGGNNSSRPYNRYNVYFILERERLVLERGGSTKWSSMTKSNPEAAQVKEGYEHLDIPKQLPPRFSHLYVPEGWYAPGPELKKRPHRRSHGVASFKELAKEIAQSWKSIDIVTHQYCTAVEKVSVPIPFLCILMGMRV